MSADSRTHFLPYNRGEKYPKHLTTDFRKIKPATLKKYIDTFDVAVRADANPVDYSVIVAKHFDSHLDVDEEDVLSRFMNAVRRVTPLQHQEPAVGKRTAAKKTVDNDMVGIDDLGLDDAAPRTRGAARSGPDVGYGQPYDPSQFRRSGAAPLQMEPRANYIDPNMNARVNGHPSNNMMYRGVADAGRANEEDELYCYCKRRSFGEMIACDNDNCPIGWFHLPCVNLQSIDAKSTWYCAQCKNNWPNQQVGNMGRNMAVGDHNAYAQMGHANMAGAKRMPAPLAGGPMRKQPAVPPAQRPVNRNGAMQAHPPIMNGNRRGVGMNEMMAPMHPGPNSGFSIPGRFPPGNMGMTPNAFAPNPRR